MSETIQKVTCRRCKKTYVPDFMNDFYQDDKEGEGSGLCERCMMKEHFGQDPKPLPSLEWSEKVCKRGCGRETCVFLVVTPNNSPSLFSCAKGSGMNNLIASRAKNREMDSRCVNCEGPPSWEIRNPPFDFDKID